MSDTIILAAVTAAGREVELSSTLPANAHISLVLGEIKGFLNAIGYHWVEAVQVTAIDDAGELVTHSSNDGFDDYDAGEDGEYDA